MVYPGATHARFEHSLGVMYVVSALFDSICEKNRRLLSEKLNINDDGLKRLKALIRLSALLHDIGHGPFSHAAEEIFPIDPETNKPFLHEDYSAAIIKHELRDVIENHPINSNYHIKATEITSFFLEKTSKDSMLWGDLLSSQMDGDRMDYLLRDSYHAGVNYGKFDLHRVLNTVTLLENPENEALTFGINEDGIHAAEGLILARYMMFTQLYFHKTRVIYDYHLVEALKEVLKKYGGHFPPPNSSANVKEFLTWDDWRVLGAIANDEGGRDGQILKKREHYRKLRETPEVPNIEDLEWIDALESELRGIGAVRRDASKSWYKFQKLNDEILVVKDSGKKKKLNSAPLSYLSSVVKGLSSVNQSRIYIPQEKREEAEIIAKNLEKKGDGS
jgi:HD superfamily phosphohydrolase